jgi:hypothetical protein
MSDNDALMLDIHAAPTERIDDIFVREAVKPVPLNSRVLEFARQGGELGERGRL